MDLDTLLSLLLSKDSIKGMSGATGSSNDAIKNVLISSLPDLLDGAILQTKNGSTLDGFAGALFDHAEDDTADLSSFFSGLNMEDSGKIVSHLLGSNKKIITAKAAKKAGVSDGEASDIITMIAPLLMSLLGQQTKSRKAKSSSDVADIIGSLLGDVDVSDVLVNLLGGSTTKTTKAKSKKNGNSFLSKLFGFLK